MAQIRLRRYEVRDGDLPDLCIRCGEPADLWTKRRFSWNPPWCYVLLLLGLVPFLIVTALLTRRMQGFYPLCNAHRYHWSGRTAFNLGGFFFALILAVAGIWLPNKEVMAVYYVVLLIAFVIWLMAAVVLQSTAIHPVEITGRTITLVGVNRRFIDALYEEEEREAQRFEDRSPRRLPSSQPEATDEITREEDRLRFQ